MCSPDAFIISRAATTRSGKARATIGKYGYYGNHAVDNGRSNLERISGATSARLDSFVTTAPGQSDVEEGRDGLGRLSL